jgi:hypothetical protein
MRRETLKTALEEICEEARETGTLLAWDQAVRLLEMDPRDQILTCVLWSEEAFGECGLTKNAFRQLLSELMREEWSTQADALPMWILWEEDGVRLSPVLYSWLEEQLPLLPKGAELIFPKAQQAYGLKRLLEEGRGIFQNCSVQKETQILCISGEAGSGRQFYMEQLCALEGMALLLLDDRYYEDTNRNQNACLLAAQLYGAFVCVRIGKENCERLLVRLSDCFGCYGIIKDMGRALTEDPKAIVRERQIKRPDRACRLKMTEDLLGDRMQKLPGELHVNQLIGRQLPTGRFLRKLKNIKAELDSGEPNIEKHSLLESSASLHLMSAERTFEELKLPLPQFEQLKRISRMIAVREEVMENWGFGQKFSYGNGMSILFYGAPGTGKTMAAQVLSHELGMPLYRVDLSQLISKYIGETQKNIGKVFDEADRCDCILLFDEADAIFAKRNEVSDAQDRYSNAETAYLLQRIEQYGGVSILATNLLQNFDDAFRRRISYMVHFPMPDTNLRVELWESIFPKDTPISAEVDARMLAQAFEMSGASIRNAALHGALLARSEGSEVRMKHILDGILNEYSKQGKAFSSSQKELLDAFR